MGLIPTLDQALGALVEDLDQRGLLSQTLVMVMGEFGRTPKLNTRAGRDHWPRVFSMVLAGGGVKGGQVIGSSDRVGESPKDTPVTPETWPTPFIGFWDSPQTELQTPMVDRSRSIKAASSFPVWFKISMADRNSPNSMIRNCNRGLRCFASACVALFGLAVRADVGDPTIRTNHPHYPGEGAFQTVEDCVAFATQGKETNQDKAIALYLWMLKHQWHLLSPRIVPPPGGPMTRAPIVRNRLFGMRTGPVFPLVMGYAEPFMPGTNLTGKLWDERASACVSGAHQQ